MVTLPQDWREFIEYVNSAKIKYLIVGAHALAHHGFPRYTGDLDIFIEPSESNAERMAGVIARFGFADLGLTAADFRSPDRVIQLGVAPHRIDILMSLTGVAFATAWPNRVETLLDGLRVSFLGRAELIANKRALGRAKDIADIEALGD